MNTANRSAIPALLLAAGIAMAATISSAEELSNNPINDETTNGFIIVEEEDIIIQVPEITEDIELPCETPAQLIGHDSMTAYPYELEILCAVVELEAGGESTECIRAVTQTILNRLKTGIWGSTLTDVLYAKTFDGRWEFSTIINISNAVIQDSTREAVMDVWENGLDWCKPSVLYFHDTTYHTFYGAVNEFSVDNMYFSSSIWNQID